MRYRDREALLGFRFYAFNFWRHNLCSLSFCWMKYRIVVCLVVGYAILVYGSFPWHRIDCGECSAKVDPVRNTQSVSVGYSHKRQEVFLPNTEILPFILGQNPVSSVFQFLIDGNSVQRGDFCTAANVGVSACADLPTGYAAIGSSLRPTSMTLNCVTTPLALDLPTFLM